MGVGGWGGDECRGSGDGTGDDWILMILILVVETILRVKIDNKFTSSISRFYSSFFSRFTHFFLFQDPKKYGHTISWSSKGNAIHVKNKSDFSKSILPQIIRSSDYLEF